ncbi:MAG: endolytic transglycosylase MltG [Coprococcus sp.]
MKGKGVIKFLISIAVIVAIVIVAGIKIKKTYNEFMDEYRGVETVAGNEGTVEEVTVEIPTGATVKEAAKILENAGVIKYKLAFELRIKETKYKDSIQPGTFTLNTGMNVMDIIKTICYVEGTKEVVEKLTIPEGYSLEQIAAACEEKGICTKQEFLSEARYYSEVGIELPFEVGSGVKYDLQGFLFPATYDIYEDTTAKSLIQDMVNAFNSVYTDEYKARAKELGYTDFEILTMASMVEREAMLDSERATIAGVFYNRLDEGMLMQIDPTVLYPLTDGMYDVQEVLYEDLEIDSPYNTYKYTGLPVGPICNPGKASIEAVLYPEEHNYLYYHTTDANDGSHVFTETYEEHIDTQ